ncbi:helicase-related protein [Halosimplex amylolyticum]|uniref:DEAD/DEAH box helicase n=1 Tax=Halosimplex amylolyticum TaxID=3396616 RepID=UPI003F5523F0
MANSNNIDIDAIVSGEQAFKADLLGDYDKSQWPDRIDYVARKLTEGDYVIDPRSHQPTYLTDGADLDKAASSHYLRGIAALTGDISRSAALPDTFDLGNLLVEFAGLQAGLEQVDRRDVPPGEILSRFITRNVQRQTRGQSAQLARQLRADAETPRELVAELTSVPEVASVVEEALPDSDGADTLTTQLAELDLSTELWDHQLESLALWLHHDMNAYVDMATATGKTVLGLAAVAHAVDSGSLHPADQQRLSDIFDDDLPDPHRDRPNDVLIVTTDDLLGVQWARMFQDHCHTPAAFTQVRESGIRLPWGHIDIRSARSMDDVDPSDYRLAIFDEVHNYSMRGGWGDHLVSFTESSCPVLAMTGSITEQLESLVQRADRSFPLVYRYTHRLALADGVIPDFEWTLSFAEVTDSDSLSQFRETARHFDDVVEYDVGTYHLENDALAEAVPELPDPTIDEMAGDYVSGPALASGLREHGDDDVAPTEQLETLAGGVGNRTIHRLNLDADIAGVVELAEQALSDGRPVLVLTRSYREAKDIWQELYDRHDDRVVRRLDADQDAAKQDSIIRSFDEAETDEKALIGPGKRIGQGNDIKSVEVGINIARPGSGVNTSLVQRLGRLLRDAGGKETVSFYHLVGVPPADATIEPDGESFVRTIAEFFGQVLEPDTDGILKPPAVSIEDGVAPDIVTLEQLGAPSVRSDPQATAIETAYATAIDDHPDGPTVSTDWFAAAFGDQTSPSDVTDADKGRVRRERDDDTRSGQDEPPGDDSSSDDDTDEPSTVDETGDGSDESVEGDDETKPAVEDNPSPLAEHYDAFRSLGIIHRAIRESARTDLPDTDPQQQWMDDARLIITEQGWGDQDSGYGGQLMERSPFSISEYREEYGTSERITEFEVVATQSLSPAITALLDESLAELESWIIPIAPESDVPLPVLVESEAELTQARALLDEFPAEPPVFIQDGPDDKTSSGNDGDSGGETADGGTSGGAAVNPSDLASTPVEDMRGLPDSATEALRVAGYEYLADLHQATDDELTAIDGISPQRVMMIRAVVGRHQEDP